MWCMNKEKKETGVYYTLGSETETRHIAAEVRQKTLNLFGKMEHFTIVVERFDCNYLETLFTHVRVELVGRSDSLRFRPLGSTNPLPSSSSPISRLSLNDWHCLPNVRNSYHSYRICIATSKLHMHSTKVILVDPSERKKHTSSNHHCHHHYAWTLVVIIKQLVCVCVCSPFC